MTLRIVLLRAMLWSLALSAATGVLAVLFQGGDLVWRVVGTGFTTAAACGLMLKASTLVDRERTRPAGLLGMAAVIVEFLMALALIWEVPERAWGLLWQDEIALTMMFSGMGVVLVMSFLELLHQPYGGAAGRLGVVVTVAAFVSLMIATWEPLRVTGRPSSPGVEPNEWWGTGGAIALFGLLAVLSLVGLGTGDRRPWRWAGIVASIIACTMWLADIWVGVGTDLGFVIFCTLISVAAVVVHANLSFFCPLTPGQRWVRGGAIAAAILTAGMIDLMVTDDKFPGIGIGQDIVGRFAAAGGIVTGCGTVALCVLARMNRKVDFEPVTPELREITVVCPRCRKRQPIRLGNSACKVCELRISVRIEEPRCPQCDYLLYGLTSDRCPECGAVIGAKSSGRMT